MPVEVNTIYIYSFVADMQFKFPAYLTNFADNRNCNWSTSEIYGRKDPIYTYKNTTRTINLEFDIPCISENSSNPIQSSLQFFKYKTMYPIYGNYKNNNILTVPPYHRVRLCNLIKSEETYTHTKTVQRNTETKTIELTKDGLLCWISEFSYFPKVDNGFFINNFDNNIYAKLFSVSLTLNVIHENLLGYKESSGTITKRSDNNTSDTPPPRAVASTPAESAIEDGVLA